MRPKLAAEVAGCVAEIQGIYGPFSFPETLLQSIWWRGDFDRRELRLTNGCALRIERAGKWNRLGGPDFEGAVVYIDGEKRVGEVEVHLRAADWRAHGHADDPAYDGVILHVVLFPPDGAMAVNASGEPLPTLVLLPLLHHDLEEYATDAAIERLADHPLARARELLAALPEAKIRDTLRQLAGKRWRQKVHFAELRIRDFGWEASCHQMALEILGYRRNRAPMTSIALAMPIEEWRSEADPEVSVRRAYFSQEERWATQGVRPANHPRTRLRQYAGWMKARPDWPDRWARALSAGPHLSLEPLSPTAKIRRIFGFTDLDLSLADAVCGGAVKGSRWRTLMCDGLLPLCAARDSDLREWLSGIWFHWFVGDLPRKFTDHLTALQITGLSDWPACNGFGQGLLAFILAAEASVSSSEGIPHGSGT